MTNNPNNTPRIPPAPIPSPPNPILLPGVFSVNINGAGINSYEKLVKIRNDFTSSNAICLFLSETKTNDLGLHFSKTFPASKFDHLFTNQGQGFCTIIKRNDLFTVKLDDKSIGTSLGHLATFSRQGQEDYNYFGIYQPPSSNFPQNWIDNLGDCSLVLGDYNAYLDHSARSTRDITISGWLETNDFTCLNDFPTFKTCSRKPGPDLAIVNNDLLIFQPTCSRLPLYSDHYGIAVIFNTNLPGCSNTRRKQKFDYRLVSRELVEWEFESLRDKPKIFEIFEIWNKFLRKCSLGKGDSSDAVGLEDKLISLKSKGQIEDFFEAYCTEANTSTNLGQAYNITKFLIDAKTNSGATLKISKLANEDSAWSTFTEQVSSPPNDNPNTRSSLEVKYKRALNYWRRILKIGHFDRFTQAEFSRVWLKMNKHSIGPDRVTSQWFPKSKSGQAKILYAINGLAISRKPLPLRLLRGQLTFIPKLPNKLRPLCVVSRLAALIEAMIALRLDQLIKASPNFMNRHGFISGRSVDTLTEQLLAKFWEKDGGNAKKALVSLDMSSAYNYVCHQRLVIKLHELIKKSKSPAHYAVILGFVYRWLGEGQRMVKYNGRRVVMRRGLPQGSPLSCATFVVAFCYDTNLGSFWCFADDGSLLICEANWALVDAKIMKVFEEFGEWCEENAQVLNVEKSKVLFFNRQKLPNNTTYNIETNSLRTLGIHLDSKLSFNAHVQSIKDWTARRLGLLKIMRCQLGFSVRTLLNIVKCWRVKFCFGTYWLLGLSANLNRQLETTFCSLVRAATGLSKLVPLKIVHEFTGLPALSTFVNYWMTVRQYWTRNDNQSIFNRAKRNRDSIVGSCNTRTKTVRETTARATRESKIKQSPFPKAIFSWIENFNERFSFIQSLKKKTDYAIKTALKRNMFAIEITKLVEDEHILNRVQELNTKYFERFGGGG